MKRQAFIQSLAAAALFGIATPFSKTLLASVLWLGEDLSILQIVAVVHTLNVHHRLEL